uniref:Antihemorrhagic factor cHLP-B n=1 Tax=Gloydius brevicauda TaxID=3148161 RepID=FETCB_GLOBR|nr:RecName: Full=Antihemorrhagic factor cHLP-B; AltName: Full=Chinese mamushi HSF-like protein B; Flags: Precursor [Gloydius brevicaudus]BAD88538.1 fetuin family protein precursor [Gloydius brevicaudus]
MNSLVALVLLGQMIGSTLSHHLQSHVDCNGEDAEKWADMAVHYINEHNLHGYKQVFNVINEIHVLPRRPRGKIIILELKLLETECHVLDPTPVENCTVRPPHYHAVEGDCDVKILHDEGVDKVIGAKCHSDPDSVEDVRRNCPKCPILLPLSDPHVVDSVEYVLNKHNEKLSGHVYEVLEISRGQHKYEPEAFYVEFAIVEVNCTAQEAHDDHHHCHPNTAGENHIGFCRATVFRSHASLEKPKDEQFESDCVIFDVKEGHAHSHLIEHHIGNYNTSPGHNNTVLNLAHSHNHTSASHESHSHEHVAEVPVAVAKREVPTNTPHDHTHPVKLCPGKVHHFKL